MPKDIGEDPFAELISAVEHKLGSIFAPARDLRIFLHKSEDTSMISRSFAMNSTTVLF